MLDSDKMSSKQADILFGQLRMVVIGVAANMTTSGPTTKDLIHRNYCNVVEYVNSKGRFNVDFKDEILSRTNTFLPQFSVCALDNSMQERLVEAFPRDKADDKQFMESVWRRRCFESENFLSK